MTYNRTEILCRRSFLWAGLVLFGNLGGFAAQYSWGQARAPIAQTEQKATTSTADLFFADLEILSRRLGIAFIAEGEPFTVSKPGPVPTLNENLSQEEAVREVSTYFDYSAVRQDNVYLLTKRYTNPDDLPDVSHEECMFGLKTVTRLLAPFNPNFPPATYVSEPRAEIARMLDEEQLAQLSGGGLPVLALTPSQKAEVWRLALSFHIQSRVDSMSTEYGYLENRSPVDPIFHWQTVMDVHAFGYDIRSISQNKMVFIPVSDNNQLGTTPDGQVLLRNNSRMKRGIAVPLLDTTDPNALSEQTKQFLMEEGKSSHALSISATLSGLNRSSVKPIFYKVDAAYANKRVTLVGVSTLSANVLLRSLAKVYGLRVLHKEDGSTILTHPFVIEAKDLSDLGRALKSAIPAPIYRAMQSRSQSIHRHQNGQEQPVLLIDYQVQGAAIRKSAQRIFRYIAEPAVKSRPGEKLALSLLGNRAQSAFELASTANMFADACWMADRPLPHFLADFDHITLTGGYNRNPQGEERFSLYYSFTDPTSGEKSLEAGIFNAKVP